MVAVAVVVVVVLPIIILFSIMLAVGPSLLVLPSGGRDETPT